MRDDGDGVKVLLLLRAVGWSQGRRGGGHAPMGVWLVLGAQSQHGVEEKKENITDRYLSYICT